MVAGSKSLPESSIKWAWRESVLTFNVEKTLQNNGTAEIYSFRVINGGEKYTLIWTDEPSSNGSYLVAFEVDGLNGENTPRVTENKNSTCRFEGAEWRIYMDWHIDYDIYELEAEIQLLCDNQIFLAIGPIIGIEGEYLLLEMPNLQGSYNTGW